MAHVGTETIDSRRSPAEAVAPGGGRRRWFRVKVVTEDGTYTGSLRLEKGRSALRELVDDDRVYLSLWAVRREGSPQVEEFIALHKTAIRYVVVVGDDEPKES